MPPLRFRSGGTFLLRGEELLGLERPVVLGPVLFEEGVELLGTAGVESPKIGVGVLQDLVTGSGGLAEDVNGDVGAVVGDALKIGQKLEKMDPKLNGAGACLQAVHMAGAELVTEQVNHFFQRLDLQGKGPRAGLVGRQRFFQRLAHRGGEIDQLPFRHG